LKEADLEASGVQRRKHKFALQWTPERDRLCLTAPWRDTEV
jgi:hypothetical protein